MKLISWENTLGQKKFKQACFPGREKYMGLQADNLVKELFHDVSVLSFESVGELTVYSRLIGISVSDTSNLEFYGLYIGGGEGDERFVVRRGVWAKKRGVVTYNELVSRLMCTSVVIKPDAGREIVNCIDGFFSNKIPPFEVVSDLSCNTLGNKKKTRLDLDMERAKFNLEYSDEAGTIIGVDDIFVRLKFCFDQSVSVGQIGGVHNPRISYSRDTLYSFLDME